MNTNMMVYKKLCVLVLWMKVASALEGLRAVIAIVISYSTKQVYTIPYTHARVRRRVTCLPLTCEW